MAWLVLPRLRSSRRQGDYVSAGAKDERAPQELEHSLFEAEALDSPFMDYEFDFLMLSSDNMGNLAIPCAELEPHNQFGREDSFDTGLQNVGSDATMADAVSASSWSQTQLLAQFGLSSSWKHGSSLLKSDCIQKRWGDSSAANFCSDNEERRKIFVPILLQQ